MKITICGSMHFSKEMLETQKKLEETGHVCFLPIAVNACVDNPRLNEDLSFCIKNDVMADHFTKISESNAILVLNYPKNGIDGYIGGSVLMEIAVAKFLRKKIFVLNSLPDQKVLRYSLEVALSQPILLNGDLNNIK